jgi:hypothetical protein
MSAATYDRINVPLSITLPIDCKPSEKFIPSSDVGNDLKVLRTLFPSIPFSKAVYLLGSNVSVCAIPPAIQRRMTVSAVELRATFAGEHPLNRLATGGPAAHAARVAALVVLIKSRLFQATFTSYSFCF